MPLQEGELIEGLKIYLPMTDSGSFLGMHVLAIGQKFNFAFTSVDKLRKFIQLGKSLNIFKTIGSQISVFQCSVEEYEQMREKDQKLPLISIDTEASPEVFQNIFVGESSKENIKITQITKENLEICFVKKTPRSF